LAGWWDIGTGAVVGVVFILGITARIFHPAVVSWKEGTTMKQTGIRYWIKKTYLVYLESFWALAVGFVASVLAA
jgi:hypothetical protein